MFGEVALVLSMQRGAYVTYPPSIFLIWVMIYFVLAKTTNHGINIRDFFRANWLKIFITVPLTVTITVAIVYSVKDYRYTKEVKNVQSTIAGVNKTATRVFDSSNRAPHWPPTATFVKENPIYGGGGDSYGWQYKEYWRKASGKYHSTYQEYYKKYGNKEGADHGTAHNLYLQTIAGKGIFGLLFLLVIIFGLLSLLVKKEFLDGKQKSLDESIVSLIVMASIIAAVIYGNVQEIFYTQPVAIVFWIMIFMGVTLIHSYKNNHIRRKKIEWLSRKLVVFLLLLIPFHVMHISFLKEPASRVLSQFSSSLTAANFESLINWIVLFGVLLSSVVMLYKVLAGWREKKYLGI